MDLIQLAKLRLANQCITHKKPDVLAVVSHLGAMQAQDYAMCKWAVGVRMQHATEEKVENAFADYSVVRTHVMRPTWHLLAQTDLRWILNLTAPQIRNGLRLRHQQLEITPEIIRESGDIVTEALLAEKSLTRDELNLCLNKAGINTGEQRSTHILLALELDGILCSGPSKEKHHTYSLLNEQIPQGLPLNPEESLRELASRYFSSHGPATAADFSWWSGLNLTTARKALELAAELLTSIQVEGKQYWLGKDVAYTEADESLIFLPAFDEFIISYKDRSAVLPDQHLEKVLSKNGIFWPVIVFNGQVAGTWSRSVKKNTVLITASFFKTPSAKLKKQSTEAAKLFADFLGKELKLHFD